DGVDDVQPRSFQRGNGCRRDAQCLINAQSLCVANENGEQDVITEPNHIFHRIGVQIKRLPLRAYQPGVEEGQRIAPHLYVVAGTAKAGDDVGGIDGLRGLTADAGPNAQKTVGGVGIGRSVMRDSIGEQIGGRNLQGDRRDIETREDVLDGRAPRSLDSSKIAPAQIDEVEDALLVELIRIVKIARDDASASGEIVDERVDERLVIETVLAAAWIAGI